jgi:O-antigen ligase
MAYKQMKIKPISFLNGYGFGSLVDLKFVAPLNDKGMRYIPILHNGYFYILFKTGLLGLFVYFGFLILLYLQAYKKVLDTDLMAIRYFISAIGLYFVFTSLIITGIYNFEETYTFILGGFLFLLFKNTNNQLINNN